MTLTTAVVLAAAALHFFFVTRQRGFFTGDGIFVASQTLMVLGTLTLTSETNPIEARYELIVLTPFLVYCFFSIVLHLASPVRSSPVEVSVSAFKGPEVFLTVLSAAIVVLYFMAVGYSAFLVGVTSLFSGVEADVGALRIESYSGARYLAPGYVNQFKNVLLPALAVAGAVALFKRKSPVALPWTVVFGVGALIGILGTGQRGAFILIGLVLVTTLRHASLGGRFIRRVIPLGLILLLITMGSTLVLGRSADSVSGHQSAGAKSGVLLRELWKRVAEDNQQSGLDAFHYTETIPMAKGQDWLDGILGLSPFHRGSPLAHKVFESIYGNDRGTSPLSIWGSVYHNFGFFGLFILPLILVVVNMYVARKFFSTPSRDILEVIGYSGIFVIVGMWVAGSPDYLFNTGLVAYIVLLWIGGIRRRRQETVDGAAGVSGVAGQGRRYS